MVLRHALAVAAVVHVVDQPTGVLAGQVALERPRGVRVPDREHQVRDVAEHQALVGHRLRQIDRAAVDDDLQTANDEHVQSGGRDYQVRLQLGT